MTIFAVLTITIPTCFAQYGIGNVVLAGAVGFYYGLDEVLWHILVICQKLLGILGKAIAAIAERRIVIIVAYSWIKTHTTNDALGVETLHLGVCIQLIEVAYSECQIRIGEELDSLCFLHAHKQTRDALDF